MWYIASRLSYAAQTDCGREFSKKDMEEEICCWNLMD